MAILYTQNSEEWKALSSIDYFTHFVKAWIPLSAWYKNYFPSCSTDRQAIDFIKSHPNRLKDKLVSLLTQQSVEGIEILYKLRNILFHGEVVPDNNANKVYEPAYQILHVLIQAL